MAVKKKTKKKAKVKIKKKVGGKSSKNKSVNTKKSTRKKSTTKKPGGTVNKKPMRKKNSASKSSATTATRKTENSNIVAKAKKQQTSAKASVIGIEKQRVVKQKLSAGKSKKVGSKVKPLTGRKIGEKGIIVRQDACLGTFFIVLDNLQNDPIYKNTEWGPYFESQLEFVKNR